MDLQKAAAGWLHSERQLLSCVSFATLGEFVGVCRKGGKLNLSADAFASVMGRLHKLMARGQIETFGHGDGSGVFTLATELLEDGWADPTDMLIVASMLLDPDADVLVTTDKYAGYRPVQEAALKRGKSVQALSVD